MTTKRFYPTDKKRCEGCRVTKPAGDFYPDGRTVTRLSEFCRACTDGLADNGVSISISRINVVRVTRERDGTVATKLCSKCREVKPAHAFGPDKRNKSGLGSWCMVCIAAKLRERAGHRTPEEKQKHLNGCRESWKQWSKENPEKAKAANLKARANYQERHPEAIRARTKLVGRGVDVYKREIVLSVLGHKCLACGTDQDITLDHVESLLTEVNNSVANLQVLCRRCNTRKGGDSTDYRTEEQRERLRLFCDP